MPLAPNFDQRLTYYLGGLASVDFGRYKTPNLPRLVRCNADMSEQELQTAYGEVIPPQVLSQKYTTYIKPAQEHFRAAGVRDDFMIYPFDSRLGFSAPTIVKSRDTAVRTSTAVILPLDHQHHWKDLAAVNERDIPFEEKKRTLLWRGVTTGNFQYSVSNPIYSSRYFVHTVPEMEGLDIGYSKIVQLHDTNTDLPVEEAKRYLRPPISVPYQLEYRYLLSLEGNDVATGLKWMLASNSTVVMPHATCETWACEGFLEPFIHYVPVKADLSDIADVYAWCLDHDAECKAIAENGKAFISQFLDATVEQNLAQAVCREYQRRVSLPKSLV